MAAVFGGATYGLGWLFTAGLASRLGIYPEEAGLTFTFIAVRTAFLVLAVLAVSAPALYIVWNSRTARRFWESGAENDSAIFNGAFLALLLALFMTCFVFLISWRPWQYRLPWSIVLTAGSAIGFTLFLVSAYVGIAKARYGSKADDPSPGWQRRRRPLGLLMVLLVGAFLCVLTWYSGAFVASQVKDGDSIDLGVLHFRPVSVNLPRSVATTLFQGEPQPDCFMYLGSADGLHVLYDPQENRILRVATASVVVLQEQTGETCTKE